MTHITDISKSLDIHADVTENEIIDSLQKRYLDRSIIGQEINDGTFWKKYHIQNVPADGLCLTHSTQKGYNVTQLKDLNLDDMLKGIKNETILNRSLYANVYQNQEDLIMEMNNYIENNYYDSTFGDILPNIISKFLNINIAIIIKDRYDYRIEIIPFNEREMTSENTVFVIKEGLHYDSVIPVINTTMSHLENSIDIWWFS